MSICEGKLKSTKQIIPLFHLVSNIGRFFFFFNLVIPKKNHKIDGVIIVLMVNVSMEEISIYSGYIRKCIQLKQWSYKLIKSKIKFLLKPIT